jgi:hypothetical protein
MLWEPHQPIQSNSQIRAAYSCASPYVFVTMPLDGADPVALGAVMSFREDEGVTMIVPDHAASAAGLTGVFPCRMVTLTVHSALDDRRGLIDG